MFLTHDPTPEADSPKEPASDSLPNQPYRWIELIVDPQYDKLSHMRVINLLGSITASVIMLLLVGYDKLTEVYFGIYLGAVGLTAVGYKYAGNNGNRHSDPEQSGYMDSRGRYWDK